MRRACPRGRSRYRFLDVETRGQPKPHGRVWSQPGRHGKLNKKWMVFGSVAAGLALLLLLAGVVFMIRTPEGTIVVRVDQPDAEISIDDGKVTLKTPGDDQPVEVEVAEGRHKLKVTKGGFQTHTKEFTIKSGARDVFHVTLVPLVLE